MTMSEIPQGGAVKGNAKGLAAGEVPGVRPFGEEQQKSEKNWIRKRRDEKWQRNRITV